MTNMKISGVRVLCAVLVLVLAGCDRAPAPDVTVAERSAPVTPSVVDPASDPPPPSPATPALRITTLDGDAYDLAERRGKWVVVNFWATWCKPCLKEMPELSAMDRAEEDIEVIGLAYEDIDPDAMRAFLARYPVEYPIAILDMYQPLEDFEEPRGLPMTYVIAPDGRVAKRILGPVTSADIEAVIEAGGGAPGEPGTASAAEAKP